MSANSFRLFRRGNIFWCQNNRTNKQESLRTRDRSAAKRLLAIKNEAQHQPQLNLQIAKVYLSGSNPEMTSRTWAMVMQQILVDKGWTPKDDGGEQEEKEGESKPAKKPELTDSEKATLRRWE